MWNDFLAGFALLLVIEGIAPFVSPDALRQALQKLIQVPDRTLRVIGLLSMLSGALLLYFVRLY